MDGRNGTLKRQADQAVKATALSNLFFAVAIALQAWTLNEVVTLKVEVASLKAKLHQQSDDATHHNSQPIAKR